MKIVNVRGVSIAAKNITYCGRPTGEWPGSPLANPFVIGRDGNRDEVIDKYRHWLWAKIQAKDPEVMAALDRLHEDSVLGCWCHPEKCHCEIIEKAWRWLQTQRKDSHLDLVPCVLCNEVRQRQELLNGMCGDCLMKGDVIAGTGHRPDKLGGYSDEVFTKLVTLAENALKELKPRRVISGMALGWDQALAQAAVNLGIPFTAAYPFDGQDSKWPAASRVKWRKLSSKADQEVWVNMGEYSAKKMQQRNEWMINHCSLVLALFNGTSGGTANCLGYAKKQGIDIKNLWSRWSK